MIILINNNDDSDYMICSFSEIKTQKYCHDDKPTFYSFETRKSCLLLQ